MTWKVNTVLPIALSIGHISSSTASKKIRKMPVECSKEECKKFDIREIFIDACKNNEIEKVIFFCDSLGLNVNTRSRDGQSSGLVEAAWNNSEEVVEWLLAQPGIQVNNMVADLDTALTAACAISLTLGLPLMVNALWHLRVSSNASGRGVLRLIKLNYCIRDAIQ